MAQTIYKYFPPSSAKLVFRHRALVFTPPKYFNDPFDLRPALDLPDELSKFVFLKWTREDMAKRANPSLDDPMEISRSGIEMHKDKERINEAITIETDRVRSIFDSSFGICCFTKVRDNPLMWSHYADSHKGFVLQFDLFHPSFKNMGTIHRVIYSQKRPLFMYKTQEHLSALYTKAKDWKYEKEYRLIVDLPRCSKMRYKDGERYIQKFPVSIVKAAYLGYNIEKETLRKISPANWTNVNFYQAQLHPTEYKMRFEKRIL
jgi:hypothetical protein